MIGALTAALAVAAVLGAGPVGPQPAPGVPGLSPEVAALPASSRDLDAANAALERATATRDRDVRDLDTTRTGLLSATEEAAAAAGLLERRGEQIGKLRAEIDRRRVAVRGIATAWYVDGTADQQSVDPTLDASRLVELRRQAVLGAAASDSAVRGVRFLSGRIEALTRGAADLQRVQDRVGGRLDELRDREGRLNAAVESDQRTVLTATVAADNARLNADVDGTDMSTVALDAYWRAAAKSRLTEPGCGMTWWVLAGIGRTESGHGTHLGSSVGVDGTVTPPVVGPPLDGTRFKLVADTDHGLLDGDPATDRAVGPMQFLPSTWRVVGRDGNGDGKADPQNIYDAADAAAVYLCRSGSVTDDAGMRRAYLRYNNSQAYVDTVVGYAIAYRGAVPLPPSPGT